MFIRFRELSVGDTFDFIEDETNPHINSFFYRCRKTGTRTYETLNGDPHTVETVNCKVFHVEYAPIKL